MYRNTNVEINLDNIKYNVEKLINDFKEYDYYFGVVKADCYGHHDIKVVKTIIDAGCNYLAVATLDEALEIRKKIKDIPILCLGIIPIKYINKCLKNDITITISNIDYLQQLLKVKHDNLKVHIKINSGMNRLGIGNRDEFNKCYNEIINSSLILEGIYTHMYDAMDKDITLKQFTKFEYITSDIDLSKIPIVHMGASDITMSYPKKKYSNACRLGIAMYGLMDTPNKDLKSTFSLYSEVIQINDVENETVGYSGAYKTQGHEKIAIVPIGYADGIIRKNTNRFVYINNKKYKIVGNICMDMLFVRVDDSVRVGDKVIIIKDSQHIKEIAKHLDTIAYEVICSISKRVPRIYIENGK